MYSTHVEYSSMRPRALQKPKRFLFREKVDCYFVEKPPTPGKLALLGSRSQGLHPQNGNNEVHVKGFRGD